MAYYTGGDPETARRSYMESVAISRQLGDKWRAANATCNLGIIAREQGDYETARSLTEEYLAIGRELDSKLIIGYALLYLGKVVQKQGDHERAGALYKESLAIRREMADKRGIANCLQGLAEVASVAGPWERAARLFGAAEALRDATGLALEPEDTADYEHYVAAVRVALGEAGEERIDRDSGQRRGPGPGFAAAWAAGRAMSLDDAIRYALTEEV